MTLKELLEVSNVDKILIHSEEGEKEEDCNFGNEQKYGDCTVFSIKGDIETSKHRFYGDVCCKPIIKAYIYKK